MEPAQITAIVNTGDDISHCGLWISPDIDTVIYTLAGEINPKTGWGLKKESWQAMESLHNLEASTSELKYGWFNLGDRDLGTHLYRTARLQAGITLSQITAEIAGAFGLQAQILPMSEDRVETRVLLENPGPENEQEIGFQEYFVRLKHSVPIKDIKYVGANEASPTPQVLEAIKSADKIILAPSNPLLSIAPILAMPKIEEALAKRIPDITAISPIVAGKALKGPADRVLSELGFESSALGVAKIYSQKIHTLVIDAQDKDLTSSIEAMGINCKPLDTIMSTPKKAEALARAVLKL